MSCLCKRWYDSHTVVSSRCIFSACVLTWSSYFSINMVVFDRKGHVHLNATFQLLGFVFKQLLTVLSSFCVLVTARLYMLSVYFPALKVAFFPRPYTPHTHITKVSIISVEVTPAILDTQANLHLSSDPGVWLTSWSWPLPPIITPSCWTGSR